MSALPPTAPTTQPLTTRQVADQFAVSTYTVTRWADDGLLPYFLTPSGRRRFRPEAIEAFTSTADNEPASA